MAGETGSGNKGEGARVERILLLLALLAVAAALIASEAARLLDRHHTRSLADEVALARGEAQAALNAVIPPETLSAASASVYLIVVNGVARGTAFVIDRDSGLLATAAHTADSLPLSEPGAVVHIVNRTSRTPIPVLSAQLHGGYGAFRRIVEEHQPVRKNSTIYAPQAVPVRDLAFDAGLIRVDPIDPVSGQNRLGPDLPIAAEESLLALSAGAPIAVIGYPYDTLDDGIMSDVGRPRAERGVIAAMIAPLDNAADEDDPEIANLIIHRLSTAGGNSGSPVLNTKGEVIGIHTHGIESVSSNADGAAQRAGVLYDLLDPDREMARMESVFIPAWRRTLSHWARADAVLPWTFFMEWERPNEDPPPLVRDIDFARSAPFQTMTRTLEFEEKTSERRISAPDLSGAESPGDLIGLTAQGGEFLIREDGEYAEVWLPIDRTQNAVIFAYDYSLRSRTGFCRITTYWREEGGSRLSVLRERASFKLALPAAAGKVSNHQFIFRRAPQCDPLSKSFLFGYVAWEPGVPGDGARLVAASASGSKSSPGPLMTHSARSPLERFLACGFGRSKRQGCEEPEFIEIESQSE